MSIQHSSNSLVFPEYYGNILKGNYTPELKKQVVQYINAYRTFEKTDNRVMTYISAWREGEKTIWYEFVSKRFKELLGCKPSEVAETFRNSILNRRIYKYVDVDVEIKREIFSRKQLDGVRKELREDVTNKGIMDAVYKISLGKNDIIWLKDLATVETYKRDKISLSLGCLTIVSKEMRAEEEQLEREKLQVLLETAGAVCHELNQPIQSISGYCESLLMNLPEDDILHLKLNKIIELTKRMSDITKKLARITKYETKDYIMGIKIVDIDKSSKVKD